MGTGTMKKIWMLMVKDVRLVGYMIPFWMIISFVYPFLSMLYAPDKISLLGAAGLWVGTSMAIKTVMEKESKNQEAVSLIFSAPFQRKEIVMGRFIFAFGIGVLFLLSSIVALLIMNAWSQFDLFSIMLVLAINILIIIITVPLSFKKEKGILPVLCFFVPIWILMAISISRDYMGKLLLSFNSTTTVGIIFTLLLLLVMAFVWALRILQREDT